MPFTVAIMQPYFLPYAGYFRLFAASDLFVIYDCVQFPRRGWVHRNQLVDSAGATRWLTLPLERAPRDVLISDLRFAPNAAQTLAERLRRFPLAAHNAPAVEHILATMREPSGSPLDYLERLLQHIAAYLELPWHVMRSSALQIPGEFRGQDRILEIARRVGAEQYVNAPGGRALYDAAAFARSGIDLEFLPDYPGPSSSILTRILNEDRDAVAADIRAGVT